MEEWSWCFYTSSRECSMGCMGPFARSCFSFL